MKPFSTYPEDRAKLLELSGTVERCCDSSLGSDIYAFQKAAIDLADLVKAILEDEQVAIEAGE